MIFFEDLLIYASASVNKPTNSDVYSVGMAEFVDTFSRVAVPDEFTHLFFIEGGALGMTVCARGNALHVGREDGDLNFPGDIYMSSKHCTVEESSGKFTLTDHDSRNGTYVRVKTEQPLNHGDYLFIGRKLLRVELNTN